MTRPKQDAPPTGEPIPVWNEGKVTVEQNARARKIKEELDAALEWGKSNDRHRLEGLHNIFRTYLGTAPGKTLARLKSYWVAIPNESGLPTWQKVLATEDLQTDMGSGFSRWLNEKKLWPFSLHAALRLFYYLAQSDFWRPGMQGARPLYRHEYYHQLVSQLGTGATTLENLASEIPGVYQCFRPSVVFPGRFVVGLFAVVRMTDTPHDVQEGKSSFILRTFELHRMEPEAFSTPNLPTAPHIEELFAGYVAKKSRQVLVHAFDTVTRSFQFTVISNFFLSNTVDDEGHVTHSTKDSRSKALIQSMAGIATGLAGQLGFFSLPTIMLRMSQDHLEDGLTDETIAGALHDLQAFKNCGIYTRDEIPPFVLSQLEATAIQLGLRPTGMVLPG